MKKKNTKRPFKPTNDPNTNFANRGSDGLCHTSDFCRKHQLVIEQLDDENFNLLDWLTAKPVSKKREMAFYKDLVREDYFFSL